MNRRLGLGFLVIVAGALVLRCPQLDRRPMHNDEAVNALKIQGLWERGVYAYDPDEYHGPALYYATLPFVWLSPARDFDHLSEKTLRLAPVFFGVTLILLLWLLRDGLGWPAALSAGALTAISPAMVFYSRYFIHEMLLVCFTFVLLVAGWRYARAPHLGWALLGGTGLGLMSATKETFVIALGAMAVAAMVTAFWAHRSDPADRAVRSLWNPKHALAGLGAATVIWVVLFTSFFTHASGLLDSLRSFVPWLHRAAGHSPHIHPFTYYFQHLIAFHQGKGPVWSEGLILFLAGVGTVSAFTRKGLAWPECARPRAQQDPQTDQGPNTGAHVAGGSLLRPGTGALRRQCPGTHGLAQPSVWLFRFIAIYTTVLALAYCMISYKTPWCMLGFLHGLILLAGLGAVVFVQFWKFPSLRIASGIVLVAASVQLVWQAWRASFEFAADGRNPYVYAQTVPDILKLEQKVEAIAKANPKGERMVIQVMAPDGDYWPLPWYLRRFKQVGWWDKSPAEPNSPVMIVGAKFEAALDEKSNKAWIMAGLFELRPRIYFELYVEASLWSRYVENLPKPREE